MVKVMCVVKGQGQIWPSKVKRYSKFYIWPWKFKGKVTTKVKPIGHIWGLEFNRYVCFSFRGNRTIFVLAEI